MMTYTNQQELSTPGSARAGGGTSRSRRADYRRSLGGLGYEQASLQLAPSAVAKPVVEPAPEPTPAVETTASTTLNNIVDSDRDNDGLCYLENAMKVLTVLEDHKTALEANGAEANAEELAKVTRLIGVLKYADELVNGSGKGKPGRLNDAAEAAFPDATVSDALKEARAMYHIMGTISVRNQPTPMRGGGVGGALAVMGGAEMIYQDEMLAGGLRPGAPLQMWWSGAYRVVGQSESTVMTAKQVYHNFTRGRIASGEAVSGHSVTFVRYDTSNPRTIWYLQQWDNQLASVELGSDEGTYFVGANLSTTGGAEQTAEYVLKNTDFKADYGKERLVAQAAAHNLDAARMSALMMAQIAASGHAELATIQGAVDRLGTPSAFDHNLVRLIGLWQHATGITCDGDFGGGSCRALTGQPFPTAEAIKADG